MDYELKITRRETNPEYKPPRNFGASLVERYDVPKYTTYDVLSVVVSQEQFEAIRKAVLDKF